MIVRDEEKYLGRCLESVKGVVDEIIIVDTGSTDNTPAIARKYGVKLFSAAWKNDFAAARNYSLDQASGEWILYLDADEELSPESREGLRQLLQDDHVEGYFLRMVSFFEDGHTLESAPDLVFRLFRNRSSYRFQGAIHEQVADQIIQANPGAKISIADGITILHYGYLSENIKDKGKKERNLRLLEKAVLANPDNRLNRFHLGVEYFRLEQWQRALANFQLALKDLDFGLIYGPKLVRYMVMCCMLTKNYPEALKYIELGLKAYPDYVDLWHYRGVICFEEREYSEAYRSFRQCLAIGQTPAHYASYSGLGSYKARYYLGLIHEAFFDYEEALANYLAAVREKPEFNQPVARIVKILNPRENPDYAEECLLKTFDLSTPAACLHLGELFYGERAYQLAWKYLQQAGENLVDPGLALLKGLTLQKLNQHFSALKELKRVPSDSSFFITAQSNIFLCHWLQDNPAKARCCLRTMTSYPEGKELREILTELVKGPKRKKASDSPGNQGSKETKYREVLLEILDRTLELGYREKAEQVLALFARFLKERPFLAIGKIYAQYGYVQEAVAELQKALEEQSSEGEIHLLLGKLLKDRGNLTEAEKHLQLALAQHSKNPEIYLELTRVYYLLARQVLEDGLSRFPEAEVLRDALKQTESELAKLSFD